MPSNDVAGVEGGGGVLGLSAGKGGHRKVGPEGDGVRGGRLGAALPLPAAPPLSHPLPRSTPCPQAGRRSLDSRGAPMHLLYDDDFSAEPTQIVPGLVTGHARPSSEK
eukprot:scaffold4717_cov109-Isochrysis_galbana.AAC.8